MLEDFHGGRVPRASAFSHHEGEVDALCTTSLSRVQVKLFVPSVGFGRIRRAPARLSQGLLPLGCRDGKIKCGGRPGKSGQVHVSRAAVGIAAGVIWASGEKQARPLMFRS